LRAAIIIRRILVTPTLGRLLVEDCGQDLIEYAFLAIFIAMAVMVGLQSISSGLNTGFSNLGAQLGSGS
jgi:Flp pilus assembly pilin Flp